MYGAPFKRQSLIRKVLCFVALFLSSRALSGQDINATSVHECETVGIRAGEPIVFPVKVFQKEFQLVLDTACNLSVFDVSFRDRLGGPIKQQQTLMPTGSRPFELFPAPELEVGLRSPVAFHSRGNVVCADFSHARNAGRGDEMGILGMDFLKSRIVRVNFNDGFAQIGQSTTNEEGQSARIDMREGRPWMPVGAGRRSSL